MFRLTEESLNRQGQRTAQLYLCARHFVSLSPHARLLANQPRSFTGK